MGNSVQGDVGKLIKQSAQPPEVLLEIYQGDNEPLQVLTKKYFHDTRGVCEGMCAIWIKYAAWPDGEEDFLRGFKNLILVEIVEAHLKFSIVKDKGRSMLNQSMETNEKLAKMLSENMSRMKELAKLFEPYTKKAEKESLSESEKKKMEEIADEIQTTSARIKKISRIVDEAGETNRVVDEQIDKALDSIHQLTVHKRLEGKNASLSKNLSALLQEANRTNNYLLIRMHKADGTPGHAIAFSATTKRDIQFLDPNTCLYRFDSIESCTVFFAKYYPTFYADSYDGYHYKVDLVGHAMFS